MEEKEHNPLQKVRRIVVKVGTSTLTHATGKLNLFRMEKLVRDIADLRNQNMEMILVTSGAIGAGMGKLGLKEKPKSMPEKQALAAIGQGLLMHTYETFFNQYGMVVAQVLLTKDDINHRGRYLNARNTLLTLLRMNVVPIINENDTVVYEEIKIGENDTLSALVAGLVDADLLIILTDIDGLYTGDPRTDPSATLIKRVEEITPEIERLAGVPGSKFGSGGMYTKIQAAKIACSSGIPMIVANGSREFIIREITAGNYQGTLFYPRDHRLSARKGWIGFASKTSGAIYLDSGAEKAIVHHGKSLLPSGIIDVQGNFERGENVSLFGARGEIARGIVNYSSEDIKRIKGKQSKDIQSVLGYLEDEEVIHRDNMTLRV